ncbi:MAG: YegS/Rv2252/BmrU family lipid kinase [Oscillospiraceae bacterium]|nr:YegS/Rv2252/BmrU family lipid kinase [Oscillospiraceae bacterium]
MKRAYMVCNLISGKAMIGFHLPKIIDRFTAAGFEVTVHPTQCQGDGTAAAQYACENGFDLVICCGGDGTLNEVIQGCMKAAVSIPIGYIPSGSTNDFARSLGIPKNPLDAVESIINGVPEKCDIGSSGSQYFTYIAAFGAFTEVSYQTAQPVKNVLGHAAYILNGMLSVTKIKTSRMRIEHDGQVIEDDFLYGMVTNSTSVAKLLSLPDMEKDDGLFEVTLIRKPRNIIDLQHIITGLTNIQLGAEKEYFDYFRTSELKVTCLDDAPASWTLDGEFGGNEKVKVIQNLQRSLTFILPENVSTII